MSGQILTIKTKAVPGKPSGSQEIVSRGVMSVLWVSWMPKRAGKVMHKTIYLLKKRSYKSQALLKETTHIQLCCQAVMS